MIATVDINVDIADEGNNALIRRKVLRALRNKGVNNETLSAVQKAEHGSCNGALAMTLVRRAIDARHGKVRVFMRYEVSFGTPSAPLSAPPSALCAPQQKMPSVSCLSRTVVVVGTGPAGLFAALTLLRHGVRPILIERGERTAQRKKDIAAISQRGVVDGESNYCFGEGGAGTFSDGKLYTRSDKRGDTKAVFAQLVEAGADTAILTDSHPHIGTDRLPAIITNIVNKITSSGGECRFHARCTKLIVEGGRVRGVIVSDTHTHKESEVRSDAVLLATGHSAADIYTMLYEAAPSALAAKGFAVGLRVEHPRALIDAIQYHGRTGLKAAEYALKTQADERGVYSFCMCPGGFVVPSSTGARECVVNGMSASGRNSLWSNSAIVMEVRTGDEELLSLPHPLSAALTAPLLPNLSLSAHGSAAFSLTGLMQRAALEREAYYRGDGQKAPAQRLTDFLMHTDSAALPAASYTPGVVPSRLDEWMPKALTGRLSSAFKAFDKKMKGFITEEALLIAIETRTSSPVRILRDRSTLQCPALPGLYAAGEGAGYAGGITSSALDGERVATEMANALAANVC